MLFEQIAPKKKSILENITTHYKTSTKSKLHPFTSHYIFITLSIQYTFRAFYRAIYYIEKKEEKKTPENMCS